MSKKKVVKKAVSVPAADVQEFELTREVWPFRTKHPKTGIVRYFIMTELDGKERDQYLTAVGKKMKTDKKGKMAGLRDFDGLQSSLLAQALTEYDGDENGNAIPGTDRAVTVEDLQSWPAKVLEALHKRAKEMSALGDEPEEDEDDEGNE